MIVNVLPNESIDTVFKQWLVFNQLDNPIYSDRFDLLKSVFTEGYNCGVIHGQGHTIAFNDSK
jgi:hypothetical protein